jgi:hypothetical protein
VPVLGALFATSAARWEMISEGICNQSSGKAKVMLSSGIATMFAWALSPQKKQGEHARARKKQSLEFHIFTNPSTASGFY